MFINRQKELAFFHSILSRRKPGPAQLLLLYGRRRVGKTALLLQWLKESEVPHTYWAAEKEPASLQRRKLLSRVQGIPYRQTPILDSWAETWEAIANRLGSARHVLVLDELPYAVDADPATLSAIQHAWDHLFQESKIVLVLCGSQVQTMEALQLHQSPLFGRLTGQWHLQPLSFSATREFFPKWAVEQRVAAYAIVGGVPAYMNWLDPDLSLEQNIRQVILSDGGMFLAEPTFLLYEEVREPQSFLAALKAIGLGYHTLGEISDHTLIPTNHLSSYLLRLQDLKMVARRLPAGLPTAKRRRSRQGRYHLQDPFFRFYFRFIAPFYNELPFNTDSVLEKVRRELRAFVGQTIFEELSAEWVLQQGRKGKLPLQPEVVGAHWSRRVQVDVLAVDWQTHSALLGECKWGDQAVRRDVIRDLLDRKTIALKRDLPEGGEEWNFHYAVFSRVGFTQPAIEELKAHDGLAIDLSRLDTDLD